MLATHRGERLVAQDRGDKFAAGFADVDDAVACALALQRACSEPIRPRIAVHTDERPLVEPCARPRALVNRAARLCDLAHGGQTVLSEIARQSIADRLTPEAWLVDLGVYRLRGIPYPERVTQLCHHDLPTDFAPLRTGKALPERYFPTPPTSFVGRKAELNELRVLVDCNRLVTLTGAGGVGKTRLALQLADDCVDRFRDGAWCVDLAPITDADLVAERIAHTLGLPDQTDRSPVDTLVRLIADQQLLIVLDNCEHLLDACARLTDTLLAASAELTIVATSREPLGVAGEVTWPTPSLSLADEAVELFTQRTWLVRPDFVGTDDDVATIAEICQRLDGVPLAIELAATRVRALSLTEIRDGLDERLQLLTGGARTVVPRQQTLRASIDWSHDLLSEPECVAFRRLAVFLGGFDLGAAHAVVAGSDLTRNQTLARITQLVDKSLVTADSTGPTTRYSMLETVRQYALEKVDEAGETDAVERRHRDHYTALFASQSSDGYPWHIRQAEIEIDNLRAAFTWSHAHGDIELAALLVSGLLPLWIHSRSLEGLAWFNAVLTGGAAVAPVIRSHLLADKTVFEGWSGHYYRVDQAEQAVAIARDLDDRALLAWALAACAFTTCYSPETALPYLREALELTPPLGDWRFGQIYGVYAYSAFVAGDLGTLRQAAEQGRKLADAVGDWSASRLCRFCLGLGDLLSGDLAKAATAGQEMAAEAAATHDPLFAAKGLMLLAEALACQGDTSGARAAAQASADITVDQAAFHRGLSLGALVDASLAAGDVPAGQVASDTACEACALPHLLAINGNPAARAALASGDAIAARRRSDEAFSLSSGVNRLLPLEIRIRIAIVEGKLGQAKQDAREALEIASQTGAYLAIPEVIECLATLAAGAGRHRDAARLFGSAVAIRDHTGAVRFKIYDADYTAAVDTVRKSMGQQDFEIRWAEGAAMSPAEAIAYACRSDGMSKGKRPSSGWASLTPAERNVVRLISAGLRDKEIAAELSVSPRTVHSHLNRIYTKLNITSRLQLAQEAAQHT
ncbi:helix-turn-helix transcriptional regulator [Mycolicibacter heraklionensis]|uniref:helix-turn-helix transcriptional regulator n=1 Tax=Mycolicibacter heraklionensis TaxID=512402 RepID=UPI0019109CD3|nr:LuxR C-terminal-related transcriptional regulator [Mycolicibacter heraklionensis]